jgi:subtilisin family serine protease
MLSFHAYASTCRRLGLVLAAASFVLGLPTRAIAGGDPAVPGEILVQLTAADALPALLTKFQLTQVTSFGARPIFRLKLIDPAASVKDTITALRKEVTVLQAEPNFEHSAPEARKNVVWAIGSEAAYTAQWAPQAIHLAQAHQFSIGAGVRVAVLDTGIDLDHPVLQGQLSPGFDFVDGDTIPAEGGSSVNAGFGHGTHVAGLIALVAPGAQIMPMRVLDAEGRGNAWVLAEAILRATENGADVINLSLGSLSRTRIMDTIARLASCTFLDIKPAVKDFDDPGYNGDRQRCAASQGAVVVAAAGNGSSDAEKQFPAAEGAYGLMPVAASANNARLAGFSNYGSWIRVAAPGDGITSTVPGGGFGTWSGTSMAAPIVAGIAALVRAQQPALSAKDLVRYLARSTSALCGASQRQIDAAAAVTGVAPVDPVCPR